jgi:heme exporter protein CcmD
MNAWGEFWAMGGHGQYVWPAFGLAFGILLAMALQSWLLRRRLRRRLAALQGNAAEEA